MRVALLAGTVALVLLACDLQLVDFHVQSRLQAFARRATSSESRVDSYKHSQSPVGSLLRRLHGQNNVDDHYDELSQTMAALSKSTEELKQMVLKLEAHPHAFVHKLKDARRKQEKRAKSKEKPAQSSEKDGHHIFDLKVGFSKFVHWAGLALRAPLDFLFALTLIVALVILVICAIVSFVETRCGFSEMEDERRMRGNAREIEMESQLEGLMQSPGFAAGTPEYGQRWQLTKIVQSCKLSMLLYPLIPVAFSSAATCEDSAPMWIYCCYAPFLLITKIIEIQMLPPTFTWGTLNVFQFVMGMIEHANWFTDVAFPVQAWKCGKSATVPWATSLNESYMGFGFAPVIMKLQIWGFAVLLLSTTAVCQMMIGSLHDAAAADVAGIGLLKPQLSSQNIKENKSDVVTVKEVEINGWMDVAKYLLQNTFQLWMQSSMFAIVSSRTTQSAKQKMLVSIGLGLFSLSVKFVESLHVAYRASQSSHPQTRCAAWWFSVLGICSVPVAVWTVATCHYAYSCKTHYAYSPEIHIFVSFCAL